MKKIFTLLLCTMCAIVAYAHDTHYSKCTAQVAKTGAGKVYVGSAQNGTPSAEKVSASQNCGQKSSKDKQTYYLSASANEGYTFVGWSESANSTSFTSIKQTNYSVEITASSTNSSAPTEKTYYAHYRYFLPEAASLDLGQTAVGSPISKSMKMTFGHLTATTISGTCTDPQFTITNTSATTDCSGEVGVAITFTPADDATAGIYSGTVTLTCGESNATFTVNAEVTEAELTFINWEQDFSSLLTDDYLGQDITLTATVVNVDGDEIVGLPITYTSSDPSVASISGNIMTINAEGEAIITATYTTDDETVRISCSDNKTVFVTDGSVCNTFLINENTQYSIGAYSAAFSKVWTKPAAKLSYDIWKQAAGTQGATVTIKDKSGNTLQTINYANNQLNSSATRKEVDLPEGAYEVRFAASGSLDKYIKNIQVTQKTYMEVVEIAVNAAGSNEVNTSVTVNYSNQPTPIRAYIKNADASTPIQLSVDPLGTGCGDYREGAALALTFRPKAGVTGRVEYNGTLVIAAGANAGLTEIELPLSVTIAVPSIALEGTTAVIEGSWNIADINTQLAAPEYAGVLSIDLTAANGLASDELNTANAGVNCIIFANRNQLSNAQNVVVDGNCANLVLMDGNAFAPVEDFHADAATYSRNMTSTYASLCLPFEAVTDENVQLFTLGEVADGSISLTYADQLAAGTPAMLKKLDEEATSITISGTNVDVVKEPVVLSGTPHLVGTFARTMVGANDASGAAANFYALKNDEFHQGQNYFYSGAFRSYVDATGASLPASLFLLEEEIDFGGGDGMTTDVESVIDTVAKRVEGIYNMQGMRLGQVMPGIICIIRYTDGTCSKVLVK